MKKPLAILLMLVLAGSSVFLNYHVGSAAPYSAHAEVEPVVLFVLPGGASATCSSWTDSCELQTAINLAQAGDEIWVGAGTYKPTSGADRAASFVLKAGVAVYGGFTGTETLREERSWGTNETILSGEIGDPNQTSDNSYHVVTTIGAPSTTVLDGFIIRDGYTVLQDPNVRGGGVFNQAGSMATFQNLLIQNNHSVIDGGGMYNHASYPSLVHVTFINNTANSLGGGMANKLSNPSLTDVDFFGNTAGYGGGMYNDASNPSLVNVEFVGNSSSLNGGGMTNWLGSAAHLTNVTFQDNTTGGMGGAIFNYASSPVFETGSITGSSAVDGGAIYNYPYQTTGSNMVLTGVTISNNTATSGNGGAIYNWSSNPILTDVEISENHATSGKGGAIFNDSSSPHLTDVNISGNTALKEGGGMYNKGTYTVHSSPVLTRVRFTQNFAQDDSYGDGGGMYNLDWCDPILTDVIFVYNHAGHHGGGMYNSQATYPVLRRVLFSENSAGTHGGGLFNTAAYPNLENVTFSGNTAVNNGGGMCSWAVIDPISMVNVTFVNNSSLYGSGDGLYSSTSSGFAITNGIFWGNGDQQIVGGGPVTYSVVQGGWSGEGNISTDPLLQPLADNGGFSQTIALGEGSPAIDAGSEAICPTVDQRVYVRPVDGDGSGGPRCDMGAYEYGSQLAAFPLLINIVGSGTVARDPDLTEYPYRSEVVLTATAAPGWVFAGWSGDATGADNSVTIEILDATNVTATFTTNSTYIPLLMR